MWKPLLDNSAAVVKSVEEVPLLQCRGGGIGADQLSKEADVSCVVTVFNDGASQMEGWDAVMSITGAVVDAVAGAAVVFAGLKD